MYDHIRSLISESNNTSGIYSSFISKPELQFRLNRNPNRYSNLLIFDFIVDFFQNSNAHILDIHIRPGCIHVDIRIDSHLDYRMRDYRSLFLIDDNWHRIFYQYDIDLINFHAFPNSSNFDRKYQIGSFGIPYSNLNKTQKTP